MDNNDKMFAELLYIFHASAMYALGKMPNPATGQIERNLEQAKQSIEMVEMIKEKTKGNLSSDLVRMVDTMLSELRMNYVDEFNKPAPGQNSAIGEQPARS
jgi:hypothetical protein